MTNKYFISINDRNILDQIGSKGKNLCLLSKKSYTIPESYFLSSKAYEYFIDKNDLEKVIHSFLQDDLLPIKNKSKKIANLIKSTDIPEEIQNELKNYNFLFKANKKWAVRSSSNFEDLSDASFAGLYDSYLNIEGLENIIDAIKKCWASLWNETAIVYREKNTLSHEQVTMAVIIQRMVNAEYAGVIFTEDPIFKNQDEVLIEYCKGLGDRLVSGEITPKLCRKDKSGKTIFQDKVPDKGKFGEDELNNLTKLALKIEKDFASPQDIEWAFDGKKFFILQSRPIPDNNKFKKSASNAIWTRANVGEVLPDVVTPLTWNIFRATLFNCPDLAFSTINNPTKEEYEGIKRIHGRVYIHLNNFLNSFCYLPYVTPEIMKKVLGVNLPPALKSYSRPGGLFVRLAQIYFILNAFGFIPRLAILRRQLPSPPAAKPDRLKNLIIWNSHCFNLHLKSTAYAIGTFAMLSHLLNSWLKGKAEGFLPLILIGHENLQTAAQGISLWDMAQYVQSYPKLMIFVKNKFNGIEDAKHLSNIDGGSKFMAMFQDFLSSNGARAVGEFELAMPRWSEDPSFVLGVMRKFLNNTSNKSSYDPKGRQQRRKEAILQIKSSLTPVKRLIFKKLLNSYTNFSTLRENIKYQLMEGYALLRKTFLDIGRELEKINIIENADDIFFLLPSEVKKLIEAKKANQKMTQLIMERKEDHKKWKAQDTSNLINGDGEKIIIPERGGLTGIGCSPGMAKGSARILFDDSEAPSLKSGEILVTHYTDPGWTPLFLHCKAIVTEIGGFLSHGATVAREYGIPAVVNVTGATKKIKTGDYIGVDGTNGLVFIYKKKP